MSAYIHGSAPGAAVGPGEGARTLLHRYELVGGVLVRRPVAERRARSAREVRLVDVLVEERAATRTIALVRGIVLREGDLARLDRVAGPAPWREFPVAEDLLRAIEEDLGARRGIPAETGVTGSRAARARAGSEMVADTAGGARRGRPALRLAAVDGVRVG